MIYIRHAGRRGVTSTRRAPNLGTSRVLVVLVPNPARTPSPPCPTNFPIFDGYAVQPTTTFGAHRGACDERIPFSVGPIFVVILVAATAPNKLSPEEACRFVVVMALCLIWIYVNNIRATKTRCGSGYAPLSAPVRSRLDRPRAQLLNAFDLEALPRGC